MPKYGVNSGPYFPVFGLSCIHIFSLKVLDLRKYTSHLIAVLRKICQRTQGQTDGGQSIKDFFSKCDQIRRYLWIWSHLLKKSLMENFIFCAMQREIRWLLYRDDHSIGKVKRIMKILDYAYSHFGSSTSISETRIQALNIEKLTSVT